MQERGRHVMGVDQYASAHVFEDLPDGGRIILDNKDASDTAAIAAIRRHMRDIETAFRAGDFTKPFQVHAMTVPGTDVMRWWQDMIGYQAIDRPRGGEVRIRSTQPVAIAGIHQFLAFQRDAHRAASR
jgi:GH25 family lysozyme M1 (1,4-beta-N-acetylmuramidase)